MKEGVAGLKAQVVAGLKAQVEFLRSRNEDTEDEYQTLLAQAEKQAEQQPQQQNEASPAPGELGSLRDRHGGVVCNLDGVQKAIATRLQEQEHGLLRAFEQRKAALEKELLSFNTGDSASELQARHRRVQNELKMAQRQAEELDRKNNKFVEKNLRLHRKLETRSDDRNAILREVVAATREIAVMHQVDTASCASPRAASSDKSGPAARSGGTDTSNAAFEQLLRTRRELRATQRKVAEEVAESRAAELQARRAEGGVLLEVIARCLDEVKVAQLKEQAPERSAHTLPRIHPAQVAVRDLGERGRDVVMGLLMSQPGLAALLYGHERADEELPSLRMTRSLPCL